MTEPRTCGRSGAGAQILKTAEFSVGRSEFKTCRCACTTPQSKSGIFTGEPGKTASIRIQSLAETWDLVSTTDYTVRLNHELSPL